ncbi:iron-containing alcohol dehydrogenase [Saccharopolyspora pogona]|uniref:iron-containing alcohol dehydrogenase n=1 Tax=Saccharopolyspora pogona TaxID=333966 RepID=UPI001686C389|nr:iron-containing alcohol dehydrogenase [Saccharopolyspora pogona]
MSDRAVHLANRIAGHVRDVHRHVPVASAHDAVALIREVAADSLLSIGGVLAVGLAKVVALDTGLPILAVPTTHAGSEMTPIYGCAAMHGAAGSGTVGRPAPGHHPG